ncbi:MAG: hypothetical protein OXG35_17175 [Acidobacteria bacterium]|nr:hypothetical protein [Acidobacteriota bacterium]
MANRLFAVLCVATLSASAPVAAGGQEEPLPTCAEVRDEVRLAQIPAVLETLALTDQISESLEESDRKAEHLRLIRQTLEVARNLVELMDDTLTLECREEAK